MPQTLTSAGDTLVVSSNQPGEVLIPSNTPLTRLNYFDGKFLRAADLELEQRYLRQLVALSNQGLGGGVVYGYALTMGSGDTLALGPGLAMEPTGNPIFLPQATTLGIADLITASRATPATSPTGTLRTLGAAGTGLFVNPSLLLRPLVLSPGVVTAAATPIAVPRPPLAASVAAFGDCEATAPPVGGVLTSVDLYVITICSAEALCGNEDVFGRLCEEACVTSSQRPYRMEGVVIRAIPLTLTTPFPTAKAVAISAGAYLRSKVAHSYFADEQLRHPNSISRDGLLSDVWCLGAGYDGGSCEVPIGLLARSGSTTLFLDTWIVRRDRMDAPARQSWQWQMMMRPWNVFLAQILQFQCQLADLLTGPSLVDRCKPERTALGDALKFIDSVRGGLANIASAPSSTIDVGNAATRFGINFTQIADLQSRLQAIVQATAAPSQLRDRVLIRGGIIELPSAGYLPVVANSSISVNDQVVALLGEGLDLRFCIVRPDYVAHALEEAQHMERISLLQGLDDLSAKPRVDILVPDGTLLKSATPPAQLFDANLAAAVEFKAAAAAAATEAALVQKGTGREETLDAGGTALYTAGVGLSQRSLVELTMLVELMAAASTNAAANVTVTPKLVTSDYVKADPTLSLGFEQLAYTGAATARNRAVFTGANAEAANTAAPSYELANTHASLTLQPQVVDGYWLTARSARRIADLSLYEQSALSARIVLAWPPLQSTAATTNAAGEIVAGTVPISTSSSTAARSTAIEAAFNGVFTVTNVDTSPDEGTLAVTGALNGTLTIAIILQNPAAEMTVEEIATKRLHLVATFTYSGTDTIGAVSLDLFDPRNPDSMNPKRPMLRLTRSTQTVAPEVRYTIFMTSNVAGTPPTTKFDPLLELRLTADSDVVLATNPYHRLAENGLDIVQAALSTEEPTFKRTAEPELFPVVPPSATGLTIQARRDWVLFQRRREKVCATDVRFPPPPPPRSFRIFNITAQTQAEADQRWNELVADEAALSAVIARLAKVGPDIVLSFSGGSSQPLFSAQAADNDWKLFSPKPGDTIAYALYGAAGEDGIDLQTSRLRVFEQAIVADSVETAAAQHRVLAPLPSTAVPPDADGFMLFITIPTAVRTDCDEVWTFPFQNDNAQPLWNALVQQLATGNQQEAEAVLKAAGAKRLTSVNFKAGTGTVADASLTNLPNLLIANEMKVRQSTPWVKPTDGNLVLSIQRLNLILATLGATPLAIGTPSNVPVPPPCRDILFLQVEPLVRTELLVVARTANNDHTIVPGAPTANVPFGWAQPRGTNLPNFVAALSPNTRIAAVSTAATGSAVDSFASARMQAVIGALGATHVDQATVMSFVGLLSTADKIALGNAQLSLTGVDDVIFLEISRSTVALRLVYVGSTDTSGNRVEDTTGGTPEPVLTVTPDGKTQGAIAAADVTAMQTKAATFSAITRVELATTSTDQQNAQARANAVLKAIQDAQAGGGPNLIANTATVSVTQITLTEINNFLFKNNQSVEEIVFLKSS